MQGPPPPQQHLRFASFFAKITPAARPLLIFFFWVNANAVLFHPQGSIISGGGFDPGISGDCGSGSAGIIPPFIITSAGGGDSEIGKLTTMTMTLKRIWSSLLILTFVGGSGGSVPALLGVLCMLFQATTSMSVPSAGRDPPKLGSLFKQRSQSESEVPPGVDLSEKQGMAKSKSYPNSARAQPRSMRDFVQFLFGDYDKADSEDEHRKSKNDNLSLSQIIPSNADDINSSDYYPGLNSILQSLYPSLEEMQDSPDFQRRHKRKSNKLGKNANELQSLFSTRENSESGGSSGGVGGTMRNNLYMNNKKEGALRREVLDRVEELDPLLCLPKVLCGYSSRRSLKNRYSRPKPSTSTTTTVKPPKGYLDDYLELLKIVQPDSVSKQKPSKKSKKIAKKKRKSNKGNGNRKKKKSEWYLNPEEDEVNEILQDGSASSESTESEEDQFPQSIHYPRYPVQSNKHEKKRGTRKFLKKMKGKDDDDDDDDDDNVEEEFGLEDDILPEKYLSDEDMAYLKKKAQMNKMMDASLAHSNENWWVPFEQSYEFYKYPHLMTSGPPEPIFDPLENTSSGGGMISWMTNMVSNMLPSMSFGGGGNDEFKNDPFFNGFQRRDLRKNGNNVRWAWGRSSFGDNPGNSSTNSTSIPRIQLGGDIARKMSRSGRMLDDELIKLLGTEMESRQLDSGMEAGRDPAEKFRAALEIGRRVADPSQCDFIYNGCPLSYEEILTVINEPMRHPQAQPFQTTPKPRPTASFQYYPSQNSLTIAPPQVISLPYYGPSSPHQVFPYQSHYQISPQHYHNQAHHQMFHQPQYQQQYPHQQNNNFHKSHQRPNSHHLQYQNQDAYGYKHQNKLDEFISQLETDADKVKPSTTGGSGFPKPHNQKTGIHQALPISEEVQINLSSSEKSKQPNDSHVLDRTGLTATSSQEISDVAQEEIQSPDTAAAAASAFSAILDLDKNQDQQEPESSNQTEVSLLLASYEFNSSSPSGYKIQRTKDKDKQLGVKLAEIANNQVVKLNASSSGTSSMEDSSDPLKSSQSSSEPPKIYSLETSPEFSDPITSHKKPPKMRTSVPPFIKKMRKKSKNKLSKYEEMLKDAFSLSESASPKRPSATKILSSLTKSISKMAKRKEKKETIRTPTPKPSEYKIRKKTPPPKRKMKTTSKKRKKDSQQKNDKDDDDGSNSNSSTGANGGSSNDIMGDPDTSINVSSSNSEDHPKKKGKLKKTNRIRLSLNKRQKKYRHQHHHHPLHLHKQSSQRIPGRKGVKRKIPPPAHTNTIYPVYGYPFPQPYGGSHYYQYHHPPYPPPRPTFTLPSPTSGSIFSYFFGR